MARAWRPWAWLLGIGVLLTSHSPAPAQRLVPNNAPRPAESVPVLSGVFPPGATIGATTEWTVSGKNLNNVEQFHITGDGVAVAEVKSRSSGSAVLIVKAAPDVEPGFRELRAEASDGLSNLLVIRVDRLAQALESEPNDSPAQANEIPEGSAAAGILKPQDLDHFRIKGRAGRSVTVEVEAQRLGTPVVPVVTILNEAGAALAQGRESRSGEHDCRLSYTFPRDGSYILQVRDNVYGGGPSAGYRLRVDEAPFATGLFPLGGPRGSSLVVTASGGNLEAPRSKTINLPDEPGAIVEVGAIDGPGGPALAPARVVVGDGPERIEPVENADGRRPTPLPINTTINGRIDRSGEVDRYELTLRKGDRIRVRVQASALGSWLDSVVTLRDTGGNTLAENDDQGSANQRGNNVFGIPAVPPDSVLEYEAKADGAIHVEVTDRYGDGGPEYGYRLSVGAPRPDFTLALLLGNPVANRGLVVGNRRAGPTASGWSGAFNLKPGSSTLVNFLITPTGRPGPVVVKAEGLPPGVSADEVRVNLPAPARGARAPTNLNAPPAGGSLVLKVAPNAEPELGNLEVVATATLEDGTTLRRVASSSLAIDLAAGGTATQPGGGQPILPLRIMTSIPVKIVGPPRAPGAAPVRRPAAPVALTRIHVPGVLLRGGRMELDLELSPPDAGARDYSVSAETKEAAIRVSGPVPASSESSASGVAIRLQAAIDAPLGVSSIVVRFRAKGRELMVTEVPIIVRDPLRVSARPDPIALKPGESGFLWVSVDREPGYSGPVELRVSGLPQGIRAPGRFVVPPGENGGMVRLLRLKSTTRAEEAVAVRVTGVARMPQGPVSVDSPIRPMVKGQAAEE